MNHQITIQTMTCDIIRGDSVKNEIGYNLDQRKCSILLKTKRFEENP